MSPRRNGLWPTSRVRSSIVPSPRPTAIAGVPSRTSRTGTLLAPSVTSRTRERPAAGLEHPADQAVGRAHRLAGRDPGRRCRPTGWRAAAATAKEEPTIRATVDLVVGLAGRGRAGRFSRRFSSSIAWRLDQLAPRLARAARCSSRILRRRPGSNCRSASPIPPKKPDDRAAGRADRRGRRRARRRERREAASGSTIAMTSSKHGERCTPPTAIDIAEEQPILRPAGEAGAPVAMAAPSPVPVPPRRSAARRGRFPPPAPGRCRARRRSADRRRR